MGKVGLSNSGCIRKCPLYAAPERIQLQKTSICTYPPALTFNQSGWHSLLVPDMLNISNLKQGSDLGVTAFTNKEMLCLHRHLDQIWWGPIYLQAYMLGALRLTEILFSRAIPLGSKPKKYVVDVHAKFHWRKGKQAYLQRDAPREVCID